ncbi:UDP-N-acetylmuramate dehydrogenase [Granulicella aggregans]|uniref:UDP-N-acetylmuramate dehydrogenase n=1 Tax=Granulicella aggregans TaxID=474949 RepID=UPI0021DFA43E|nr:UDP-N-acetylmuramate dehydrogenase [Granulicella aggregans]
MTIEENVLLGPLTTLGVGGAAKYLVRVRSEGGLVEAVEFARAKALPVFVLGGGSNLLVGDNGFHGLVLRMEIAGSLAFDEKNDAVEVEAAAGMDWDGFVLATCERGLSGVECLAGIPGMVGGTPVQNVGAYGQEVAETIVSVRALDLTTMQFVSLSAAECGFAYRRSIFNSTARGRYVVTSVTFRFDRRLRVELRYAELQRRFEGQSPTPMEVYQAVREIRHGKGMLLVPGEADCRSAGSFFKNPVVSSAVFQRISDAAEGAVPYWDAGEGKVKLAAAWLVEQAGFHKGFAMGRAGISSSHTLAVVNRGGATAGEIVALRDEIVRRVEERFSVQLEQEPVILGDSRRLSSPASSL